MSVFSFQRFYNHPGLKCTGREEIKVIRGIDQSTHRCDPLSSIPPPLAINTASWVMRMNGHVR